jgi:hypothetical protein
MEYHSIRRPGEQSLYPGRGAAFFMLLRRAGTYSR